MHFENARDALNAGKHVLCEKAATSNAPELKVLLKLAKEKNLFFMEAMWTRFMPFTKEIKQIAEDGQLGDPIVLHADLSADFHPESEFMKFVNSSISLISSPPADTPHEGPSSRRWSIA